MIIIEVENTSINTKQGNKNGKDWAMRFQQVVFHGTYVDGFQSRHPRESTVQLEDGQAAYAVGKYVLGADAYYFGDFGKFTLGRMKLQPLAAYLAEMGEQLGLTITKNATPAVKAAA